MVQKSFIPLERIIGVIFRKKDLLAQALTHRSSIRQSRLHGNNERLEFLGDAVLELVVTDHLFRSSDRPEGELTNWRSALVQREQLAHVARIIKLGEYLSMSRGEELSGGREKVSTLANALEALIGAIYLDQGFEGAHAFCRQFIFVQLEELLAQGKDRDEKSLLQEQAQEHLGITPHYQVISESGPDHDKHFICAAFLSKTLIAEGHGNSKQRAEQDAAKNALKVKKWKIKP